MDACSSAAMPPPKSRRPSFLLLLIASCIATAASATADDNNPPSQQELSSSSSSSSQGEWQLLHASIGVSAMHMQLLPGDFVLMFDRTDTGPSNLSLSTPCPTTSSTTGPTVTDCTAHSVLLDLRTNALYPYPLATNPWCSSGALLPNGTLLQTGGFSSGDRVARLFSPSTGWVELGPTSLSARRWYSSDLLLPDSRVLLLGGRRQFNLEFFPHDISPATSPLTAFPFLEETTDADAENNLYPFLHLLPDGTVFVFANDRAVVYDPYSRAPLRRLPPVPGGVPRNYPSSGSSVLLPLRASSTGGPTTHAEVLVCGGAPRGSYQLALRNGTFLPADRTCARIRLQVLGPTAAADVITEAEGDVAWDVEEMPAGRVMGDMVLLPTGEVLIVNGAGKGTAGWELGREPVLRPVVYGPERPVGERFGPELAEARTARMYHSTAALDTFGRVLVGGSNPHVGYVFAGPNVTYPTELSLEAFLPPYLGPRHDAARPRILAAPLEVGYGEPAAVRFAVPADEVTEVVVRAVAPAFATHSFGMNQRVVELAAVGGGAARLDVGVYEVVVAAPPTPGVAPPGYYMWFVVHAGVPSSSAAWVRMRPLGPGT